MNIYMKNRKKNLEQIKTEEFFERLYDKSVSKTVSWFVLGILLFLIMIASMLPAQEIYAGAENDSPMIMSGVLTMLSFMMVSMRTSPFKQYTENQKSRIMKEILQYHPISKKEIWKMKTSNLLRFLAKVTVVGVLLQCIVAFIAYGEISWLNFFHIFICVFLFPIVGELVFDSIMRTFIEE